MSHIPVAKAPSGGGPPRPNLSKIATATGSQLDLLTGKRPGLSREVSSASIKRTTSEPETFKVGDRVWVGGTKQGTVRYIGETKFAPGEWAGVELDEPQGKNDGSVAGEIYFKCAANHGVFSRCSRLARKQSVVAQDTLASTNRKISMSNNPPTSPNSSTMDLRGSSTSPTLSPAESTSSVSGGPLQLGDRVIVASAMAGTKTGTLRYIGPTEFAKGEWAGIELDAPLGKNDGSVDGKKYFECAANFGLFAPLHKVTKSPKMKMMKPSPLTPGKLRRESSNLSDASSIASVARSLKSPLRSGGGGEGRKESVVGLVTPATVKSNTAALKDALREKESYIEQLLKDRDLERSEVARAACQTDEVESKLHGVERQLAEAVKEKEEVEEERERLAILLEEERKKVEDLQFRLEEVEIQQAEGETAASPTADSPANQETLQNLQAKLREFEVSSQQLQKDKASVEQQLEEQLAAKQQLEEQLAAKRQLEEQLAALAKELAHEQKRSETEANKVFEAEEQAMILTEELSMLRKKLDAAEKQLGQEQARIKDLQESQREAGTASQETILRLETETRQLEAKQLDLVHEAARLKETAESSAVKYSEAASELAAAIKDRQEARAGEASLREDLAQMKAAEGRWREQVASLSSRTEEIAKQLNDKTEALAASSKEIEILKRSLESSGSEAHEQLQLRLAEVNSLTGQLAEANQRISILTKEAEETAGKMEDLKAGKTKADTSIAQLTELQANFEKEISTLKESLTNSAEEVGRLHDLVGRKEAEMEKLLLESEARAETSAQLQEQFLQLQLAAERDKQQLEQQLASQQEAADKALKAAKDQAEGLTKNFDTAKAKHESDLKELSELGQSELKRLTKEVERRDSRLAELEATLAALRAEAGQTGSRAEDAAAQAARLESLLTEARQQVEILQARLDDKETALVSARFTAAEAAQEASAALGTVKERLRLAEVELEGSRETVSGLKDEKSRLEGQLSCLTEQTSGANEQMEQLRLAHQESSQELSAAKESLLELKEKLARLQCEKEGREAALTKELDAARVEADRQLQQLTAQLEEARSCAQAAEKKSQKQLAELQEVLEAARRDKNRMIAESEEAKRGADLLRQQLELAKDEAADKQEKIDRLAAKRDELVGQLERVRTAHDEEMGEMIDVVNDLKVKEDELASVHRDLANQNRRIDELCKQLLSQEQSHKETLKRKEAEAEKRQELAASQLTEAKSQAAFLKEQMAAARVEADLAAEKQRLEAAAIQAEADGQAAIVRQLKDELAARGEELEFLKEELQAKKDELEEVSTDLDIREASFNNETQETEERHKEEVEQLIAKNEALNQRIGELSEKMARQTAECDAKVAEMFRAKKEEVGELRGQLTDRESQILDLESRIKALEDNVSTAEATMKGEAGLAATKIERMSGENESLRRTKYELETSVKNLRAEKEHIVSINEGLSIRIVEFEVQVQEMQSQFQSLQIEYQKQQLELTDRQEMSSQASSLAADMERTLAQERNRVDELQVSLNDMEAERDQLTSQVAELSASLTALSNVEADRVSMAEEVATLNKKNQFLFEELAKERLRLESKIETLAETGESRRRELAAVTKELEMVKQENSQLSSYKRQLLMLEQEKKDLETQLVQLAAESRIRRVKSPSPFSEGEDSLRGQVEFLNSVIVDMQRKNDALRTKLEIFENAGIIDESEFIFNGVSSRQAAPRLFCDICDEFDLHDTEDCPKQATVVVEESGHSKHSGKRKEPRPYCDTCEMFGHDTKDCNDNETF